MIVGMMAARDEAPIVELAIRSVAPHIDLLVFVDHKSNDNTGEIVSKVCEELGIPLDAMKYTQDAYIAELRYLLLKRAQVHNPEWIMTVDADSLFVNNIDIRKMLRDTAYDQFWFRSTHVTGDGDIIRVQGVSIPHPWIFRNKAGIQVGANLCANEGTHTSCPDKDRTLRLNLNGIKEKHILFNRTHIHHMRIFNEKYNTQYKLETYIRKGFPGGAPTDEYVDSFVVNRLRRMGNNTISRIAKIKNMTKDEFMDKRMHIDWSLWNDWDCKFELILDNEGKVVGRKPDLINVEHLVDDTTNIYTVIPPNYRRYNA